eukprot:gnl/TRDRNA2_/TRDRNA2_103927_c0_seq1.p1 gnl/TRDRNA2_/TRDRNA2_103927_c0~~gnl/TRDRNA2_/TRDRNA2_103927_c0_seq1.p1  ORF type:complete len:195 (-),score=17.53 gnl/TRDRNA2_/TRDRNA2_103927_c0_seq1:84-668(-)
MAAFTDTTNVTAVAEAIHNLVDVLRPVSHDTLRTAMSSLEYDIVDKLRNVVLDTMPSPLPVRRMQEQTCVTTCESRNHDGTCDAMKVEDCEWSFTKAEGAPHLTNQYCNMWQQISECFAHTGCSSSELTCNEQISTKDDSSCNSCKPSNVEACKAEHRYFKSTFYAACASVSCSKILHAGVIWAIIVMFTVTWV